MTFVFCDTETTGLEPAFDQILQFAAIVTDDALKVVEEVTLRCRLQPHIVPSPEAMLVTRVGPTAISAAPISFYEMIGAIQKLIAKWTPTTFIGFNNISYDENMLRQAFYQTLHPVYPTNTNGNTRMDVLRLAHAVAEYRADAIQVPMNEKGKPSFRLGDLIGANGLKLDQAHDALADARATLELARLLRARAPDIWDRLFCCRSRQGVEELLKKEGVVLFTDRSFRKPTILAGYFAQNPQNQASLAMFDFGYDPAVYLDIDVERALQLLKSNPRPIRIARANALPILFPVKLGSDADINIATARKRLAQIQAHPTFANTIAEAMAGQYADAELSPYIEEHIYDGFPSPADRDLMAKFHEQPWADRVTLIEKFGDKRFREFGGRIIYSECPGALPVERRRALDTWRQARLIATDKVPWCTLKDARQELDELKAAASPEDAGLLREIDGYLANLSRPFAHG